VFALTENLYDVVETWTSGDWKGRFYLQVVNEVSKALSSIGHGDTPLGNAMYELWEWFEDISGPSGYGIRQTDLQKELSSLLGRESLKTLRDVEIEVIETPSMRVSVLNLDELKATADPEHEAKAKKRFQEMFSAFVDDDRD